MRRFLILCCFCFNLLISCQNNSMANRTYDYSDFIHLQIKWDDVFIQKEDCYWVYFYSHECYYCESFKNEMLNYVAISKKKIYLLSYQESIPIRSNIQATIGANNIEQMWFGGTPSLLCLENKFVIENILGVQNISDYCKSNKLD